MKFINQYIPLLFDLGIILSYERLTELFSNLPHNYPGYYLLLVFVAYVIFCFSCYFLQKEPFKSDLMEAFIGYMSIGFAIFFLVMFFTSSIEIFDKYQYASAETEYNALWYFMNTSRWGEYLQMIFGILFLLVPVLLAFLPTVFLLNIKSDSSESPNRVYFFSFLSNLGIALMIFLSTFHYEQVLFGPDTKPETLTLPMFIIIYLVMYFLWMFLGAYPRFLIALKNFNYWNFGSLLIMNAYLTWVLIKPWFQIVETV